MPKKIKRYIGSRRQESPAYRNAVEFVKTYGVEAAKKKRQRISRGVTKLTPGHHRDSIENARLGFDDAIRNQKETS